jgi:tRNA nucleotidyltransferase/poly(A) polymerase
MEGGDKTGQGLASLKDADWLKRRATQTVFDALTGDGVETRAVGGAVRNAFLKLPVAEVDLATTAMPHEVIALAEKAGLKSVPTGIDHGTVTVIADGAPFEVTTLRRDVETFGRHAEVAFTRDWEADAKRRDFTLNALYADREGTVFDPLGGHADLAAGRVRFIGNPAERIREDYLRILRFFRFNAYYGRGPLDPAGLHACVALRDGLAQLSAERIWTELKRILLAPRAADAVQALFDYGFLTELLGGVPRLLDFERLVAIDSANGLNPSVSLRLAVLAIFVEEDAARLAERLRLSNAEQAVLALAAGLPQGLPQEALAKAALYRLGPENYRVAVLIAWARSGHASDDARWIEALDLPMHWQVPDYPLRGQDIMALGIAGSEVGSMLRRLEQEWIEGGFADTREKLLEKAAALAR